MEQDLYCPVCCDIFKDPVILTCSHSFCKACLQQFWDIRGCKECPMCRVRSTQTEPVTNRILKNLCEAALQKKKGQRASTGPEILCNVHGEKLKLFCLEDQLPVCVVCRDAKVHLNHRFHPISDVASEYKEQIQTTILNPLLAKLPVCEDFKMACDQTLKHIKTQADNSVTQIKKEFEKLHQFLRNEEAARTAAVREEEMKKSETMQREIEKISKDISSLSDSIRDIEDAMGADDVTFLKNYKFTVKRGECILEDPEMLSGALIDVANHLGNLRFKVWEKMQCVAEYAPLILDPNTAHPNLTVSEDLMSIQYSEQKKQLPDNPERFDEYPSVLGSEGFSSGTHSWDVEVGDSPSWEVGVMLESAQVKGTDEDENETGRWVLIYDDTEYKAYSGAVSLKRMITSEPLIPLKVKEKPKRIRVEFSLDKGKVSFSDPDNNTLLHKFTHRFWFWNDDEKVFPYFKTHSSLRIIPVKAKITVEQPS